MHSLGPGFGSGFRLSGSFLSRLLLFSIVMTMTRKVFGIGWAKTGTTTLGGALRILGFHHQGQNLSLLPQALSGDLLKAKRIALNADSFDDWPWILLYKEMNELFPDSKFVLTTREPSDWLRSYRRMLAREGPPSPYLLSMRELIYGFDVHSGSDADLVNRYLRHCADVSDYFSAAPDKLLVVNWSLGHGWKELCDFLSLPIPTAPFPWLNKS